MGRLRQATLGLLAIIAVACGGGATKTWQPACVANADCDSGVCLGGTCADADGDPDHDGLASADEVRLRLDPLDPDTDGDGLLDGAEVGPDPQIPLDEDGDGRIDAGESASADVDRDCVPDQFDPRDGVPDASPADVARRACLARGVCGQHPEAIVATCTDGVAVCGYADVPGWRPPREGCTVGPAGCDEDRCDGQDNDCDGKADEGFSLSGVPLGRPCTAAGRCGSGIAECDVADPGRTVCSTAPGGTQDASAPEVCNGADDDCDGSTDEDLAWRGVPLGQACSGRGECGPGVVECRADGIAGCSSEAEGSADQSRAEKCNERDDDCDGLTDDDVVFADPEAICPSRGICVDWPGRVEVLCVDGEPQCDYSAVPGWSGAEEVRCDGKDDDCDGQQDEAPAFRVLDPVLGWRSVGQACGYGACQGGLVACAADGRSGTCSTGYRATPEVCNGLDDDCDGTVDNGLPQAWSDTALQVDAGEPPPRAAAGIAWVPAGAAGTAGLWIQGGIARLSQDGEVLDAHSDLWRFDPVTRRFQSYGPGLPGPRAGGRLVHDPANSRLLLVGGRLDSMASPLLAFDLVRERWSEAGPSVRQDAVLAAVLEPYTRDLLFLRMDAEKHVAVLVRVPAPGDAPAVEIEIGSAWREDAAAAADPASGRFYVVGGRTGGRPVDGGFLAISPQGAVQTLAVQGSLPARYRHAATVLPDGSVLVAGGASATGDPKAEAWLLAPGADGAGWRIQPVAAPLSGMLLWPSLCATTDAAWLASGVSKDGAGLRQVARYDLAAGTWSSEVLTRLPPPRSGAVLAVFPHQRSALVLGGTLQDLFGDRRAADAWRLSLESLAFEAFPPTGVSLSFRGGAQAVDTVRGVLYLHGGLSDTADRAPVDRFLAVRLDPAGAEELPSGPGARHSHAMAWTGSALVLIGGEGAEGRLSDTWRWDLSGTWHRLQAPGIARAGHAMAWDASSGRVLVIGGTPAGDVDTVDPQTGARENLFQDATLAAPVQVAAFDPDSRSVLLDFGPDQPPRVLDLHPPVTLRALPGTVVPPLDSMAGAYDPVFRRALFFGGVPAGTDPFVGAPGSSLWLLVQGCPGF